MEKSKLKIENNKMSLGLALVLAAGSLPAVPAHAGFFDAPPDTFKECKKKLLDRADKYQHIADGLKIQYSILAGKPYDYKAGNFGGLTAAGAGAGCLIGMSMSYVITPAGGLAWCAAGLALGAGADAIEHSQEKAIENHRPEEGTSRSAINDLAGKIAVLDMVTLENRWLVREFYLPTLPADSASSIHDRDNFETFHALFEGLHGSSVRGTGASSLGGQLFRVIEKYGKCENGVPSMDEIIKEVMGVHAGQNPIALNSNDDPRVLGVLGFKNVPASSPASTESLEKVDASSAQAARP